LIDTCSNWEDKDRVSLQQLLLNLNETGYCSGHLYEETRNQVNSWTEGAIIRPSEDPFFNQIIGLANPDEKPLVMKARYSELFYTYRNCLVHEFREPGYGIEMSVDPSTPYYHGMTNSPWQLVFPLPFIKELCLTCLNGLREYLITNEVNPYDSYGFGSMWSIG